ncbi:MAG: helix-turn-helix domain-containing protein [Kineosporiaceae bacterium]
MSIARQAPHRVAVHAFDGMAPFELGVAAEVFALPRPELEVPRWYSLEVFAERPGRIRLVGGLAADVAHGPEIVERADTVVVVGVPDVRDDPPAVLTDALAAARDRGARLVSFCSGAFALAAAGVLDGRRATTHWRYADLLACRFPRIAVDPRVLYVDEGNVLTSAGTAAGIDLCLHLVRRDHGAQVANAVARRMVVSPHRTGGQAQFVESPVAREAGGDPVVTAATTWAQVRLGERFGVSELAGAAHCSVRTLNRRFAAVTGVSPLQWVLARRVAEASRLLETTALSVEEVGRRAGIPDPAAFRRHFTRQVGLPPSAHRRQFGLRSSAGR